MIITTEATKLGIKDSHPSIEIDVANAFCSQIAFGDSWKIDEISQQITKTEEDITQSKHCKITAKLVLFVLPALNELREFYFPRA